MHIIRETQLYRSVYHLNFITSNFVIFWLIIIDIYFFNENKEMLSSLYYITLYY